MLVDGIFTIAQLRGVTRLLVQGKIGHFRTNSENISYSAQTSVCSTILSKFQAGGTLNGSRILTTTNIQNTGQGSL